MKKNFVLISLLVGVFLAGHYSAYALALTKLMDENTLLWTLVLVGTFFTIITWSLNHEFIAGIQFITLIISDILCLQFTGQAEFWRVSSWTIAASSVFIIVNLVLKVVDYIKQRQQFIKLKDQVQRLTT